MVTTTTTMNNALDQRAAALRARTAWVTRAVGFFAAVFLITMSATGHVSHAATSGESATQPISSSQRHESSVATAAPGKSATQATREAYQQREASSKDLGDFAGGHAGLYIGGSSVAVVLLIVLLIILI